MLRIRELRIVKKIIRECSWRLGKVLQASHTPQNAPAHSHIQKGHFYDNFLRQTFPSAFGRLIQPRAVVKFGKVLQASHTPQQVKCTITSRGQLLMFWAFYPTQIIVKFLLSLISWLHGLELMPPSEACQPTKVMESLSDIHFLYSQEEIAIQTQLSFNTRLLVQNTLWLPFTYQPLFHHSPPGAVCVKQATPLCFLGWFAAAPPLSFERHSHAHRVVVRWLSIYISFPLVM